MLAWRRADGFGAARGGGNASFVPWAEVSEWLVGEGLEGIPLPRAEPRAPGRRRADTARAELGGEVTAALARWLDEDPDGQRLAEGARRLGLGPAATNTLAVLASVQRWPTLGLLWRKLGGDPVVDGLTPLAISALLPHDRDACLAAMLPGGALTRLGLLVFEGRLPDPRRPVALLPSVTAVLLGGAPEVFRDAAGDGLLVAPAGEDERPPTRFATRSVTRATADALADGRQGPVFLRGPDARVRRDTALAAAQLLGRPTLYAHGAGRDEDDARALFETFAWAGPLLDAVVVVDGVDGWAEALAPEVAALSARGGPSLVLGHLGDLPAVHGAMPDAIHLRTRPATPRMREVLVDDLVGATSHAREAMAGVLREFALDLDTTDAVARDLDARAATLSGGQPVPSGLVAESLRLHLGSRVTDIAEHVPTRGGLRELEMTPDARASLESIVVAWRRQETLLETWGFGRRLTGAASLSALFFGPPGTGKTLAASMLAHELGLQLFRVDLSRVVDKYIGETEKQLEKVFTEAERSQVMLLFDEADSLFGARTDVKKASDRYSNLQVSFLLQRIEVHRGIVVLTTNHEASLDQAFRRRIRYSVPFPMPSADERAALWRRLIPDATPVDEELFFDELGEDFVLSGGHIRNAVLRAAFVAAAAGRGLRHDDLVDAANAEYRSLGHVVRSRPNP